MLLWLTPVVLGLAKSMVISFVYGDVLVIGELPMCCRRIR